MLLSGVVFCCSCGVVMRYGDGYDMLPGAKLCRGVMLAGCNVSSCVVLRYMYIMLCGGIARRYVVELCYNVM